MVTIQVDDDVWRYLTSQKDPGDSHNDVLRRELGLDESADQGRSSDEQRVVPDELPQTVDAEQADDAIAAAVARLRESSATKSELVQEIMPEHDCGYDAAAAVAKIEAGDRYRGAWWRRVVKPGLEKHPAVSEPARGGSEWRAR
jgi:hypothetical protein